MRPKHLVSQECKLATSDLSVTQSFRKNVQHSLLKLQIRLDMGHQYESSLDAANAHHPSRGQAVLGNDVLEPTQVIAVNRSRIIARRSSFGRSSPFFIAETKR